MLSRSPAKLALLALATAAIALTSGCGGRGKLRDTAYVARDVDTLYAAAKDKLDRGDTQVADEVFSFARALPGCGRSIRDDVMAVLPEKSYAWAASE